MSSYLIVSAYPEAKSFGGTLEKILEKELTARGHAVETSNLFRQKFMPVSFSDSFTERANKDFYSLEDEQRHAGITNTHTPDIQAEQKKLAKADNVIFLCPLYWSGPPAMLRGWFERVLTPIFAHDSPGKRTFETGPLRGKTAVFVTSAGSKLGHTTDEEAKAHASKYYDPLRDRPLHYCGFKTLDTVVLPRYMKDHTDPAARAAALAEATGKILSGLGLAPATPVQMQTAGMLIHLNGRPGVGKKTVGLELAKFMGARFLDNHLLLNPGNAVAGRGTAGYYRVNEAVRKAVYNEIEKELPSTSFVLTNALTNEIELHRATFSDIRATAKGAGVPFVSVLLTCDEEENVKRLSDPTREKDMKLTDPAELKRLLQTHTMINEGLTLDVSNLTAGEAAAKLFSMISRAPAPAVKAPAP